MANILLKTAGQDVQELETSYYLSSDVFPNTTTLYGWHLNSTDPTAAWVGGITTTENGSIASSTDHLGNTADCDFDGTNDYLSSANAAFAFTGNFSVSCWLYTASGIGADQGIVTRVDGTATGWKLYAGTDSNFYFQTYNSVGGNNTKATYPLAQIPSGWVHICGTRSASRMDLYINGKWVGSYTGGAPLSYAAAGNLEIGSLNGGTKKFTGRISEVVIHDGTAWSENQVRQIYARGARRFAALDQSGIVNIPQNETIYYPERQLSVSGTNWTTKFAYGIPYVDTNGRWRLKFNVGGSFSVSTANPSVTIAGCVATSEITTHIAVTGTSLSGANNVQYCYVSQSSNPLNLVAQLSTSQSQMSWSGDVPLASKPNI